MRTYIVQYICDGFISSHLNSLVSGRSSWSLLAGLALVPDEARKTRQSGLSLLPGDDLVQSQQPPLISALPLPPLNSG